MLDTITQAVTGDEHFEVPSTTRGLTISSLSDDRFIPSKNPKFYNADEPGGYLNRMGFNLTQQSDNGFTIEHDSGPRFQNIMVLALRTIKTTNPDMEYLCL